MSFEWKCAACGFPIENGKGYITVSMADVRRYEDWETARQREHFRESEEEWITRGAKDEDWHLVPQGGSMEEMAEWPDAAQWRPFHESDQCDPRYESGSGTDYVIPVEKIRTWAQLADWTAHLLEKTWFATATDWSSFIRYAQTCMK